MMRLAVVVLAACEWLTGINMEELPFEALRARPRRQFTAAQYEMERQGESVIVTIHAGRKPTGGYSVQVRRVVKESARCTVHYAVIEPPPDAMVPQVITYPAAMVRFRSACTEVRVEPPLPRAAKAGEER